MLKKNTLNIIYKNIESSEDNWQQYNIAKKLLSKDTQSVKALEIYSKLLSTITDKSARIEIAKTLALSDPSNGLAIDTLCQSVYMSGFLSICIDEQDLPLPVLEQIDPSKKLAIKALEKFAGETKDRDALIYIIKHLKRLDPNNTVAQRRLNRIITAVINSMQTYNHDDDTCLINVGIYWRGIMCSQLLPEIIIALKPYLKEQSLPGYDNHNIACGIIWDCAKQIDYQDFYQAWHTQTSDS